MPDGVIQLVLRVPYLTIDTYRLCCGAPRKHGVIYFPWSCQKRAWQREGQKKLPPLQSQVIEWPLRAIGAIQMRTVLSSEADASIRGLVGFQLTLLTVPEWPSSCAKRSPLSLCHMCTRQSCICTCSCQTLIGSSGSQRPSMSMGNSVLTQHDDTARSRQGSPGHAIRSAKFLPLIQRPQRLR